MLNYAYAHIYLVTITLKIMLALSAKAYLEHRSKLSLPYISVVLAYQECSLHLNVK